MSSSSRGPRFSRRIANAAQAASAFDAPVLASLPDLRIRSADRSQGSTAHRRLGANLLELGTAREWRALLFVAPGRRQGKAIAVAAAALGLLQADAQPVVLELDSGGTDVKQLLGGVNVDVRDARSASSRELPALVEEARAAATCVVGSGGPLLGGDVKSILDAFDAVVVVARAGVTTPAEARVLRAVLASAGIEVAGVVLTESNDGEISPRELRTRLRAAAGASPELDEREAAVEAREQAVEAREAEVARREAELERRERAAEEEAAQREREAEELRAAAADWGDPERGRWRLARLEQAAEDVRGTDPQRAEEIGFYLEALRPLAGDDGLLPASVDSVVDEAFGDLLPR